MKQIPRIALGILILILVQGCSNSRITTPPVGNDIAPPVWVDTVGITAATAGVGQVTVEWGTATDADSPPVEYLVYVDTDTNPWDTQPIVRSTSDPYIADGLTVGDTYWFGVRCRDSANPANVDENTVVLSAVPGNQADMSPPVWDDTVGVIGVTAGEGSVTVEWGTATDLESPPVEYLVYMDTDIDPWDVEPIVRETNDPYTFENLRYGDYYSFGVRCRDSAEIPNVDRNLGFRVKRTIPRGWAVSWGVTENAGYVRGYDVMMDDNGDVYVYGEFIAAVDFDPGPGENIFLGADDAFISKFDSNGAWLWSTQSGGSPVGMVFNSIGNICIVTNRWIYDENVNRLYFINSSGEYENVIYFDEDISINAIALDDADNIYLAGSFKSTVDFDPGWNDYNVTTSGNHDAFLAKYNWSGTLVWVKTWGGTAYDYNTTVCVTGNSNVICGGSFEDEVDFDPGSNEVTAVSNGENDVYLCSYTSDGEFNWVQTWGNENHDYILGRLGCNSGQIYTTGDFEGVIDLDPGPVIYNVGSVDTAGWYVCKFSESGQLLSSVLFEYDDPSDFWIRDIAVSDHTIGLCGSYRGTIDFVPGNGTEIRPLFTGSGKFLLTLTSESDVNWIRSYENIDSLNCRGMFIDSAGSVMYTGSFSDTMDFDPGPAVDMHENTSGYPSAFISKLAPDGWW